MTKKNTAPRVGVYVRVSTTEQDFASQLHALREFCRRHGWKFPARDLVFSEKVSGAKDKRAELDRLLRATRAGLVDTVLTYRADRLGRSMLHLVNLLGEFQNQKIRLVGVADNFDNADNSPDARFRQTLLFGLAQLERERIVERTHAGLAAARKAGRIGGRPRRSDEQIARVLAWRTRNPAASVREIARESGLSASYVSRLLSGKRVAKTSPQKKRAAA